MAQLLEDRHFRKYSLLTSFRLEKDLLRSVPIGTGGGDGTVSHTLA